MNATTLADAARRYAAPYAATLAPTIVKQIEQAFVARWLYAQDVSIATNASLTANAALSLLAA